MSSGRFGRRFGTVALVVITAIAGLLLTQGAVFGAGPEPGYLGAFGPDGTEASDFERVGSAAVDQQTGYVYVEDTVKGALYKFSETGQPVNFGGSEPYISGNEISGLTFQIQNGKSQAAVDSAAHVVYVTSGPSVRAFEENGEPHDFSAGPGAGTSEIPGATELAGVAVDADGNIYAADLAGKIRIYTSSGAELTEVETPAMEPANLAVAPSGDLLVIDRSEQRAKKLVPSIFPVTPSTTYTTEPKAIAEHFTGSVGVDPTTGFIYLTQFINTPFPGFRLVSVFDEHGNQIGTLGSKGQEGEFQGELTGIAISGSKRVYVSVRTESTTPEHSKEQMFEPFVIFKGAPTITSTSVTNITTNTATLRGYINPNTLETTYRFEYGLANCATSPGACTTVPSGGATIGSGHEPVLVTHALSGLSAGSTYYYRVVAKNLEGVTEGPVRSFTTQTSEFDFQLADGRVWEQVSPIDKFGGGIVGATGQAAADGNGFAFSTLGSIEKEPEGNRSLELSAVLARRSGDKWQAKDLVPPHTEATQFGPGPEYKIFSKDLGKAVLEPRDGTPLSPEASERTPYLRRNTVPPVFRPIVTSKEGFANVPPGTVFGGKVTGGRNPVALRGTNDELTDIVVSSATPLLPGAQKHALYRWKDGTLTPVSELPATEGGGIVTGQVGSGPLSVLNGVSEDGSRVFWSPLESLGATLELPALYLRNTVAEESMRIDVVQSGASGAGPPNPAFMSASSDGAAVFFTDSQQLTPDANPSGRDLYRCEVGEVEGSLGCSALTDLSAPVVGGESADAEEFASGFSEDGNTLYFVAKGVLDNQSNAFGESPEPGAPNLYVWKKGSGVRFIALLSEEDRPDWGQPGAFPVGQASGSSAFSSPSGRYLTFMSERNLTGEESNDPATGQPTEEIFLYDSETGALECISCNPRGGTDPARQQISAGTEGGLISPDPLGHWAGRFIGATLPTTAESEATIGYSFYRPRAMLDNGRLFFNSVAPLVAADSNGTWDAYEYEPLQTGSCGLSSGSATTARSGNGCVSLISSGTDSNPSVFLDASETGDDAFFVTFARLSALDNDDLVDVYDARVNGVAAVAPTETECQGEGCQSRVSPPSDSPPNSATFNGAGNIKAGQGNKHCRRTQRKVRRKGKVRCVKRSRKVGKHHAKPGAGK